MTDTDTARTSDEAAEAFEATHKLWLRDIASTDTLMGPSAPPRRIHRRERTVSLDDRQAVDGLALYHLRALLEFCEVAGMLDTSTVKVTVDPLGDTLTVEARETSSFADGDQ
jgi:hypothetical protein